MLYLQRVSENSYIEFDANPFILDNNNNNTELMATFCHFVCFHSDLSSQVLHFDVHLCNTDNLLQTDTYCHACCKMFINQRAQRKLKWHTAWRAFDKMTRGIIVTLLFETNWYPSYIDIIVIDVQKLYLKKLELVCTSFGVDILQYKPMTSSVDKTKPTRCHFLYSLFLF